MLSGKTYVGLEWRSAPASSPETGRLSATMRSILHFPVGGLAHVIVKLHYKIYCINKCFWHFFVCREAVEKLHFRILSLQAIDFIFMAILFGKSLNNMFLILSGQVD